MGQPSKIMLIRHGEKPEAKGQAPFGVMVDGTEDFESLTVLGWQRAGALAVLFAPTHGQLQDHRLAKPDAIFASAATGEEVDAFGKKIGSKSKRPLQTITPLAAKLAITPKTDFTEGEESDLVQTVLGTDGVVLISWQHEAIPDIADGIVRSSPPDTLIPSRWPGDRFDVVWVLTPPASANDKWGFDQVPQEVLAGDRKSVIK